MKSPPDLPPLLAPDETPPFTLVNESGTSPVVLLCDHASPRIPQRLKQLGLSPAELGSHIAWDIGAEALARDLALRLDATLVVSGYSRLLIDCNRSPCSPESIPESSHGVLIPGNLDLGPEERQQRRNTLFQPYQDAITRLLQAPRRRSAILLSIHSFNPHLQDCDRPWFLGVCYGQDDRLARPFLRFLPGLVDGPVGDNVPYDIDPQIDYTLPHHTRHSGLLHVMLEIRNDRITTAAQVAQYGHWISSAWQQVAPHCAP